MLPSTPAASRIYGRHGMLKSEELEMMFEMMAE
jgi:hypothetical protein